MKQFLVGDHTHQMRKNQLTAYDEATGKPKRDPLISIIMENSRSKSNLMQKFHSRSTSRDDRSFLGTDQARSSSVVHDTCGFKQIID